MKKHIIAMAIALVASGCFSGQAATNYPWLTFTLADNSEVSVPSENLQLTYAAGDLHLTSATVDQTLSLSSLKSMRFETVQAGIERVESDANPPIEVFNPQGVKVGVFPSIEETINALPHGAYILRTAKTAKKVMF